MAALMMSAPSSSTISTRASIRRANKPLLEKRRRARINASLNQLKVLVLETLQKDSARYSKLEKADILEMTVVHLKSLRHQQKTVNPHRLITQYGAGYKECANEIRRYLDSTGTLDGALQTRLENHLATCIRKVDLASVDINLTFDSKESVQIASPAYTLLLPSPPSLSFPVEMERLQLATRNFQVSSADDMKMRQFEGEVTGVSDQCLNNILLSYLGVSSQSPSICSPSKHRSLESDVAGLTKLKSVQGLDENGNIPGRENLQVREGSSHHFSGLNRFSTMRSDTIKDLLMKTIDIGRGRSVVGYGPISESVWRPW